MRIHISDQAYRLAALELEPIWTTKHGRGTRHVFDLGTDEARELAGQLDHAATQVPPGPTSNHQRRALAVAATHIRVELARLTLGADGRRTVADDVAFLLEAVEMLKYTSDALIKRVRQLEARVPAPGVRADRPPTGGPDAG